MKIFANVESMLTEVHSMETDELNRRQDRATVAAFFHGKPPLTQAQADACGMRVNVNNLFGYTDLAAAKEATLALYNKPARLWTVSLDSAPIADKTKWEIGTARAFNRIVKKYGRLKLAYEGVAGDATLHGEGEFFFPDRYAPIPRQLPLSKRLIPTNASADPAELTHWVVAHDLSLKEICRHVRNRSEGWDIGALTKIKNSLLKREENKWEDSRVVSAIDSMNPEELEYARQAQGDFDKAFRTHYPVYYFFQIDPDLPGAPVCLDVIPRGYDRSNSSDRPTSLFSGEEVYGCVKEAIQPFFMDCVLGGAPLWHRVKGLGHLNYAIAWQIEMLMCKLMQGAGESAQTWWKATDAANREELEKIMLRHNGIIPENIELVPDRPSMNFEGVMSVLQVFRQQAARNSRSSFSNPDEGGGKELQVQAMFRQNAIGAQQSSRYANWYESKSQLGATMFARYTDPDLDPHCDPFYSEKLEFQSELRRQGIPLYYVQPFNVDVQASKITGDGDDMKAKQTATFLMANLTMYPPEAQQRVKQMVTGIMADDYALAEELVPLDGAVPADQVRAAEGENNTAIIQGRPPKLDDKDVDEVHVQTHFDGLGSILQQAASLHEETFTPPQLMAFKALGAHTIAHIQRMQAMGKKDLARQAMESMNELSKMAEKFRHNLEQQQQQQQEQGAGVDPVEQAKLELAHANLQLADKKQQFAQYKFERVQATREHGGSLDQSVKLAQDARADELHRANLAEKDTKTALEVARTAKDLKEPAPAAA